MNSNEEPDWRRIMRELQGAEEDDPRRSYMQSGEPFGPTIEAREFWVKYGTRTTVN